MDLPGQIIMDYKMASVSWFPLFTAATLGALYQHVGAQAPEEITGEYCFLEEFTAQCNGSDVIFMTKANYGRMQAGKCIKGEVGFLGCSKDILPYMDRQCSGRSTCTVKVIALRDLFNACSKELFSYLEVSYVCQPVTVVSEEDCLSYNESRVPEMNGVIFSGTPFSGMIGTLACPWSIAASPGQQLKFTLYDFTLRDTAASSSSSAGSPNRGSGSVGRGNQGRPIACAAVLVVRETSRDRDTRIELCDGSMRQRHIYTTDSNMAHVAIVFAENLREQPYFLISYEAVGCPAFPAPESMWATVEADIATVVCNYTGETWYLICRGTSWSGDLGNCTKVDKPPPVGQSDFPWGILIAVGIGIAIGTVVGLALLGIVFLCRRCICQRKRKPGLPTQQPSLTAREVPPMNELIRSATVMAKQGDPRAPAYQTRVETIRPYTTQKFSHQVEYHPQGSVASRDEHVYESYIYKDGTIRSRKDSATESTGSGYCDMEGSVIGDFPAGPPMKTPPVSHVTDIGMTTAHPVGGGGTDELGK